jgi:hypothetical protein
MLRPLLAVATILAAACAAYARPIPFEPGETLTYSVRWESLPVAEVRLQVLPIEQVAGQPAYHFAFLVESHPVVAAIYPVHGRIDAFTDLGVTRSLRLEKNIIQGRSRKIYRVDFDWEDGVAHYANEEGKHRRLRLRQGTLDILSVLYHARTIPLLRGEEFRRPLNDGRKTLAARARIVEREVIHVDGRAWRAVRIEPDLRKTGKASRKAAAPDLRLWISDDERRLPLRLFGRLPVGRFTVELAGGEPAPY